MTDFSYKTIVIGDCNVGKTALLRHLKDQPFEEHCMHTIGIDFIMHRVKSVGGNGVRLQIWDTSGQERFRTITRAYYRGARAIILVFDLTDHKTFANVKEWYKDAMEEQVANEEGDNPILVIVGTKNDLGRAVSAKECRTFTTDIDAFYTETSAKTGDGIHDIFQLVADQLLTLELAQRAAGVASNYGKHIVARTKQRPSRCSSCPIS